MNGSEWQDRYGERSADRLSWFQSEPSVSLAMIEACGLAPEDPLIDAGGGASVLVDRLLERGYRNLAVLDLADAALEACRSRLGPKADHVRWFLGDVTTWEPDTAYALWHDRAVFHFLVAENARRAYLWTLEQALRPDSHLVLGTFSPNGPPRCSGLPVVRYSAPELEKFFAPGFELLESRREEHRTPAGAVQEFQWARFRRTRGAHPTTSNPRVRPG